MPEGGFPPITVSGMFSGPYPIFMIIIMIDSYQAALVFLMLGPVGPL